MIRSEQLQSAKLDGMAPMARRSSCSRERPDAERERAEAPDRTDAGASRISTRVVPSRM